MSFVDEEALAKRDPLKGAEDFAPISEESARFLLGSARRSTHLVQIMEAVLDKEAMTITELKANPGKVIKSLDRGPQWVRDGKSAEEVRALMISKEDVELLCDAIRSAAQPRYLSASAFAARLRHDGPPSAVALNPPAEAPYERPETYEDALMGRSSG